MAVTVLLAEHSLLPYAGLYVLIHVRPGESEQQAVGPRLVHEAHLGHYSLVMVGVVKAFYAVKLLGIKAVRGEVEHRGVNVVIVVGVILEGVYLVGKAATEGLTEVDVRLVRIERAVGIRRIDEPPAAFLVGDNVDYAADSVGSEAYGDDTFIHFYAVGEVHGDVVQAERRAHSLLLHAVDEHLYVLAAEAVEHEIHVRAHPAALAELQSGSLGEGLAQRLGGVEHAFSVNGHGVVCRVLHAAHAGRHHRHLGKMYRVLLRP